MVLAGEIEELRAQVEAAERARKIAESELHEASDRVSELSTSASSFSAQKRKLENDIQAMHVSAAAAAAGRVRFDNTRCPPPKKKNKQLTEVELR